MPALTAQSLPPPGKTAQDFVHRVHAPLIGVEEREHPGDVCCAGLLKANIQVLVPENRDLRLLWPHGHGDRAHVELDYSRQVLGLQQA